jgi:hypothetical protein
MPATEVDIQNYKVPTEITLCLEVKYSLNCAEFHDTAFYQNQTKLHKYGQQKFKPLRNVWQSLYYRLFTSLINSERNHIEIFQSGCVANRPRNMNTGRNSFTPLNIAMPIFRQFMLARQILCTELIRILWKFFTRFGGWYQATDETSRRILSPHKAFSVFGDERLKMNLNRRFV